MPTPRAVPVVAPIPNDCPQADAIRDQTAAMDRQTAKMQELIDTVGKAVETFTPAANAVADLGAAQKKLCDFILKNRLKLVGGFVGVLVAIGAISPNAAQALQTILSAFGN